MMKSDEEILEAVLRGELKMHEIERAVGGDVILSLIHISEPTRPY